MTLATALVCIVLQAASSSATSQPSAHAHLHPAHSELYLELPDLRSVRASWPSTVLGSWFADESIRAALESGAGVELSSPSALIAECASAAFDLPREELDAAVPDFMQLHSLSVSARGSESLSDAVAELRRAREARDLLVEIDTAIAEHVAGNGSLPESLEQLYAARGEALPVDPWGRAFVYAHASGGDVESAEDAEGYSCFSTGPDGKADAGENWIDDLVAEDEDADIALAFALRALELQLVLRFENDSAAERAAQFLFEHLSPELERTTDSFEVLLFDSAPLQVWHRGAWLALGCQPDFASAIAARSAQPEGGAQAEARAHFAILGEESSAGHAYLRGFQTLGVLDLLLPVLEQEGGPMNSFFEPLTRVFSPSSPTRRAFSTRMLEGRFETRTFDYEATGEASGADWFRWWAPAAATPQRLAARIDPEAVVVMGATVDGAAMGEVLLGELARESGQELEPWLEEFAAQHAGLRLDQELFAQLGPNAALYSMPIEALGVPQTYAWIELRDAARFEAALGKLAETLMGKLPEEISLRTREYKDIPLTRLSLGEQSFVSPTFCVFEGALLVAGTEAHAKRLLRARLDAPLATQHAWLAPDRAWPSELQSYLFVDWPKLLGSASKVLGGAASSVGQMFGDAGATLPTFPSVTSIVKPLSALERTTERVAGGTLTRTRNCFGPDLWVAGALLAFGVSDNEEVVLESEDSSIADDAELRDYEAQIGMGQLVGALYLYRAEHQAYPASLAELHNPSESFPQGYLSGELMPVDPWGRAFVYVQLADGREFEMRCLGPDGIDQAGEGDDIRFER